MVWQMKWYLISICLVWAWKLLVVAILHAAWLLQKSVVGVGMWGERGVASNYITIALAGQLPIL